MQFAQRYPFSLQAKHFLKNNNLSLENIPEEIIARAEAMVSSAAKGKEYALVINSSELLLQEIMAFPISKILVSLQKDSFLNEKFAWMLSKNFLEYLDLEKNKKQAALELAEQLGIKFDFLGKEFFVSLALKEFLGIEFKAPALKLVNQAVSQGKIFLSEQAFYRFLSEIVFIKALDSLPVPTDGLPQLLKNSGQRLQQQLSARAKKEFEFKFSGKLNPNLFPSCMQSMYNDLLEGKNLPHMARFYISTFLHTIGLPQEQIINMFRKTPNFSEKMTRYQIRRIAGQKLAVASCSKIKEHSLCPDAGCGTKHPLIFYRKQLRPRRQTNAK